MDILLLIIIIIFTCVFTKGLEDFDFKNIGSDEILFCV